MKGSELTLSASPSASDRDDVALVYFAFQKTCLYSILGIFTGIEVEVEASFVLMIMGLGGDTGDAFMT